MARQLRPLYFFRAFLPESQLAPVQAIAWMVAGDRFLAAYALNADSSAIKGHATR
jgi:hypothetical protein